MAICNTYLYPLSGNIADMESWSSVICLEPIDCLPTCQIGILSDCADLWNCDKQNSGSRYFNPLIAGDTFQMQTLFLDRFNPDPEVPVTGFTAAGLGFITCELLDEDGAVISDDHTTFASKYLVGWSGTESYQLIEIDFDLIKTNYPTIECFSFKLVAYDSLNVEVDSICSEHFEEFTNDCKDTMIIKSVSGSDCCNNYYGSPETFVGNANFIYNNSWRFHASIRRINTEFEKTSFGTKRTKVELNRIYLLQLKKAIPPYLFEYLTEILLAGEKVFIGGEPVFIDTFSFNNESERKMFIGRVEVFTTCDTNFRCG